MSRLSCETGDPAVPANTGSRHPGAKRRATLCAKCTAPCLTRAAPAQALLASSHLYHEVKKNAESHGVIVDGVKMDIGKMMAQKETAVSGLTKGIEGLFKKYKARIAVTWDPVMPYDTLRRTRGIAGLFKSYKARIPMTRDALMSYNTLRQTRGIEGLLKKCKARIAMTWGPSHHTTYCAGPK